MLVLYGLTIFSLFLQISKFAGCNKVKTIAASSTHHWALTDKSLAFSGDLELGEVWHSIPFDLDDPLVKIEAQEGYLVGVSASNSIDFIRPRDNESHLFASTLQSASFTLPAEVVGGLIDDIVSIAGTESIVHVFATVEVDGKFPGGAAESDETLATADD